MPNNGAHSVFQGHITHIIHCLFDTDALYKQGQRKPLTLTLTSEPGTEPRLCVDVWNKQNSD